MTDPELLQAAIEHEARARGLEHLSTRKFAEEVLIRDERSVRRWLEGKQPLPPIVRRVLRDRLGLGPENV